MLSIPANRHDLIKGKKILKLLMKKKLNIDYFKIKKVALLILYKVG